MAGFPYINQVSDRATQQALQAAFEEITALKSRITQLEARAQAMTGLNAHGGRVVGVANPEAPNDAVNLQTLRTIVQAQVGSF